jgi:hypothetical protein
MDKGGDSPSEGKLFAKMDPGGDMIYPEDQHPSDSGMMKPRHSHWVWGLRLTLFYNYSNLSFK